MKDFSIIALAGAAGSGKDTAADMLKQHFGFQPKSFAAPMKRALATMFGWPMAQFDNREWKERVIPEFGKSPRQLLQTLGTEWGRNLVHPDIWLMLAKQAAESLRRSGAPGVVFTDCRFENEANTVRQMGGMVLHIARPGVAAVATHVSENLLPSHVVDAQIVNDGSLLDLRQRVVAAVASYSSL